MLKRCALPKFHVIDGQNPHDLLQVVEVANAHDQIAFDTFHSFLMEAEMKLATYMQYMRNSMPED